MPHQLPPSPLNQLKEIVVELTNICNLHCKYCVRDEEALYSKTPQYFQPALLRRILQEARQCSDIEYVSFTGGEVTLHPEFSSILDVVKSEGLKFSFVTNGWHFDRVYPLVNKYRGALRHVAFSLDGARKETHDRFRGEGSFARVIRAISRCFDSKIPFGIKATITKANVPELESLALLSARLGADFLAFGHLLPTSSDLDIELSLSQSERTNAEREIAILARIFKMAIRIGAGYYNIDSAPPCVALQGKTCNIDYQGRLTLCCHLSGYRGADNESDIVADLRLDNFSVGLDRLRSLVSEQLNRRAEALANFASRGEKPDLNTGSPCLFCINTLGKAPWQRPYQSPPFRSLPVVQLPQA